MGVDFIREQSGKPWRKRWDKGLDRLKSPGLFDVQFTDQQRTITADLEVKSALKVGDQVVLQCDGQSVIVCSGHRQVGAIQGLTADVRAAIAGCGGVALGTVERVGLFGNNAELSIQ